MKFTMPDGRVKDCVLREYGNSKTKFWVTPNKGWLVAHEDGTPIKGCSVYEEPIEEVAVFEEVLPDASWLVADIKLWLDANGIAYTSKMLKDELLALV